VTEIAACSGSGSSWTCQRRCRPRCHGSKKLAACQWCQCGLDQTGSDVVDEKMCTRELHFSVIQLQLIGCHASQNLINTDGHFLTEVGRICGSAKPVDLSVVHVGMRNQLWRFTNCSRSAVYRRNRIGPRTNPCKQHETENSSVCS